MPGAGHYANDRIPAIEGYEVLERLGQGGTSSVWKARQVSLGRIVVIKALSEQRAQDPEDIRNFKREALIAANLKHPGIVQVHDFGQFSAGAGYYVVMEYISGYTVGSWLRRKGRLGETDALLIARGVAEALRYAWDEAMIVHCDIKPDNLMVDGDGSIKVTDLGLAQVVSTLSAPAADTICIMGTPNYMSPEQARGAAQLDCRTDIYALGASLHHILSGQLPFGVGSQDEIMRRQIAEPYPDLPAVAPGISPGTAGLVMRMLAKDPNQRPQDWGAVLAALAALEKERLGPAAAPASMLSAATIPLQVVGLETGQQPAAGAADGEEDEYRDCPYCAEPIRKRAIFCRYCGRKIPKKPTSRAPPAPRPAPAAAAAPAVSPSAASARAASPRAETGGESGAADQPPPKLSDFRVRREAPIWGHIRMAISICLLVFLAYYAYQRFINRRDVLEPVRAILRR